MKNVIEGFDPEIDETDLCPMGGGHKFVLDRIIRTKDKVYEDLRCTACGYISRGWYLNKDYKG